MFFPELSDVIYVPEFQSFVGIGLDTVMVQSVYTSTNTLAWEEVLFVRDAYFSRVIFAHGEFWVVGTDPNRAGLLLRLRDGTPWIDTANPKVPPLTAIALAGDDSLVAVGGGGTILQSRTPSTPPQFNLEAAKLLPDGSFALALDKTPGTTVSVESSLDLRNWQPVKSVTNWIGRVEGVDQGKNRAQFYRAKAF